jgi:hypothetical protein
MGYAVVANNLMIGHKNNLVKSTFQFHLHSYVKLYYSDTFTPQ